MRHMRKATIFLVFALAATQASAASITSLSPSAVGHSVSGPIMVTKSDSNQPVVRGPSVSSAISTALSVGGADAHSLRGGSVVTGDPLSAAQPGAAVRYNIAPTVQSAIGVAVSIGGNSASGAHNTTDRGVAAD